jgi:hypothetical protein
MALLPDHAFAGHIAASILPPYLAQILRKLIHIKGFRRTFVGPQIMGIQPAVMMEAIHRQRLDLRQQGSWRERYSQKLVSVDLPVPGGALRKTIVRRCGLAACIFDSCCNNGL